MSDSSYRISRLAAAALVLLRLGIGVHFLAEGAGKLAEQRPFSAAFFGNAKGPLAGFYKGLVWDPDGLYRLDFEGTKAHWDQFRNRVVRHYRFDEKQTTAAGEALADYQERLNRFLAENSEKVTEYGQRLERRKKNAEDPTRQLASLQTHDAKINAELLKMRGELLPAIDGLWRDFENALNGIASEEQWQRHGRLEIGKPGRRPLDSLTMDAIIPYFDLTIGGCLILGLLTPVAALVAAAFLASVCLSQWPLSPGAIPIYYQAVEMLALLVLAATGAGRFLGVDYFLGGLKAWCCPPKKTGAEK